MRGTLAGQAQNAASGASCAVSCGGADDAKCQGSGNDNVKQIVLFALTFSAFADTMSKRGVDG